MFRFLMLLPIAALLSGCWWDDAPEIYKVTVSYTEDGGSTHSKTFVCDFRGQSSKRKCNEYFGWGNDHFALAANPDHPAYKNVQDEEISKIVQQEFTDLTTEYARLSLSAHARKEGRYQMQLFLSRAWKLENAPSATDDRGKSVFIVSDSELREGFSQSFVPAFDDMEDAYTREFGHRNAQLIRMLSPSTFEGDAFFVKTTRPFSRATLTVTWSPIDEEDITRSDNVS